MAGLSPVYAHRSQDTEQEVAAPLTRVLMTPDSGLMTKYYNVPHGSMPGLRSTLTASPLYRAVGT